MKTNHLLPVVFLSLTSCLSPALRRAPPHVFFQLQKVDGFVLSNSQMFIQKPVVKNRLSNSNEITFRFLLTKVGVAPAQFDFNQARFTFLSYSLPAQCEVLPAKEATKTDCKIELTAESLVKLGKSDLIGELSVPFVGGSKGIVSSIFVRNEELK